MKTINHNCKCWTILLYLLVWLPIESMAQTVQFEMVVEKTDGTEIAFRITDDYPVLQYLYGGEDGINTLEIQTANGYTSVPCPEIKRLITREAKVIPGDANGDGRVDIADIVVVVNYLTGNESGDFIFDDADANKDGTVNTSDIVQIVKIIMGN